MGFSRFLLASVGIHAAVILPWVYSPPRISGHLETVLSVTFDGPERHAAPALPTTKTSTLRKPARQEQTPGEQVARPVSAAVTVAVKVPQPANESAPSADGAAPSREAARASIQTQLLADLHRYFEYPLIARHKGWQGTVWLSVTVEPDGTLDRIFIAKSSGHDALDRSALLALKRVPPLADTGLWLNGRALKMPLPVIYRLVDR